VAIEKSRKAKVLIESCRRHYNAVMPHSSLGYRPPAPEAILSLACSRPTLRSACRLAKADLTAPVRPVSLQGTGRL